MVINHNMSSINAHRVTKFKNWDLNLNIEKISSGMRINNASDDASGLAVSEKMRTQIRGLRQAERNTENGISFVQTADGYLDQMSSIMQRVRELAIQSSNGIYTERDRQLMQVEVSQLVDEVDRVASQAEFNTLKLFQGDFARGSKLASMWFHMGPNMHQRERVYIATMNALALNLKPNGNSIAISTAGKANDTIGVIDNALGTLMKQRATLGAYSNRLEIAAKGLFTAYENVQAAESNIRDTDIAEEVIELTKNQLLIQSGTAMLAQSNLKQNVILGLLQ